MDILERHITHIRATIEALTAWLTWLEAQRGGRRVTRAVFEEAMQPLYSTDALVFFMESPVDCGPAELSLDALAEAIVEEEQTI